MMKPHSANMHVGRLFFQFSGAAPANGYYDENGEYWPDPGKPMLDPILPEGDGPFWAVLIGLILLIGAIIYFG